MNPHVLVALVAASGLLVSDAGSGRLVGAQDHERRDVTPHASSTFVRFAHSSGLFSLEHPADWRAHEVGGRTNIGADNGLVKTGQGFRTVYGAIVGLIDDPLAKSGEPPSLERSARAVVDAVLARNAHQALHKPVSADGTLAGGPAYSAEIMGTSPVTGRAEWARIICRRYGHSQIFHVILVSPAADRGVIEPALDRMRASVVLREAQIAAGARSAGLARRPLASGSRAAALPPFAPGAPHRVRRWQVPGKSAKSA